MFTFTFNGEQILSFPIWIIPFIMLLWFTLKWVSRLMWLRALWARLLREGFREEGKK